MCLALLTTAHPDYALIVLDNRDEFVLRPTSRPHWWSPSGATQNQSQNDGAGDGAGDRTSASNDGAAGPATAVLSSRDLQRAERGTWLGISRGGNLAVLTNYREDDQAAVSGQRSRGAIVTEWLGADPAEDVAGFVSRMLSDGDGLKGIGGFSLILGKLRRRRGATQKQDAGQAGPGSEVTDIDTSIDTDAQPGEDGLGADKREKMRARTSQYLDPLAILSNRVDRAGQIPWIAGVRGETHGLSNTIYADSSDPTTAPTLWPKVRKGMDLLRERVANAVADSGAKACVSEAEFIESLFGVLDEDDFPYQEVEGGKGGAAAAAAAAAVSRGEVELQESIPLLKHTIFVPPLGDRKCHKEMEMAAARGAAVQKAKAQRAQGEQDKCVNGLEASDWPVDSSCGREPQQEQQERPQEKQKQQHQHQQQQQHQHQHQPRAPTLSAQAREALKKEARPDSPPAGFMTGLYGTQRQTVMLVDWDGNVTFTERALWDEHGHPVARGKGDTVFKFKVQGWDDGDEAS